MIFDGGMAFDLMQTGPAQGYAVVDRHMVTDLRRFTDDHAHAMVNENVSTDPRAGMDFDPCNAAHELWDPARKKF